MKYMLNGACTAWYSFINDRVSFISFRGKDSNAIRASPSVVNIRLCDCNGNGACDFENVLEDGNVNEDFKIVQCNCTVGWIGMNRCILL